MEARDDLDLASRADLRELAQSLGLATSGSKATIKERIRSCHKAPAVRCEVDLTAEGLLRAKGKDTYYARSWLREQGGQYDKDNQWWVFPLSTTATASSILDQVALAACYEHRRRQVNRQAALIKARLKNQELNDPDKARERAVNYDAFRLGGGVDWLTHGPNDRCVRCKAFYWAKPVNPSYLMNCPRCGFGGT